MDVDDALAKTAKMLDCRLDPLKKEIHDLNFELEKKYLPFLVNMSEAYLNRYDSYSPEYRDMKLMQMDTAAIKIMLNHQNDEMKRIENDIHKKFDSVDSTLQAITDQLQNLTCMVGELS